MNNIKLVGMLLLIISVVSCVTKKSSLVEVKVENETDSIVYIYRPYSTSNIVISPDVLMDGEKQAEIENNKYLYLVVPQGEHTVELDLTQRYTGQQQLTLNIEKGKAIYIRVNTSMKFQKNKLYDRSFSFEVIEKEAARLEMQETVYAGKENKKQSDTKLVNSEKQQDVKQDQFSISKTRNPFGK